MLLPGGALEGEARELPADWSSLAPFGTVQLETNPEEPYSVNIAGMLVDGVPQVNAGDTETKWVRNMNANPDVRLQIHGRIYDLRALKS